MLSSLQFACVYVENDHHLYSIDELDHHTLGEKVGISLRPNFLLTLEQLTSILHFFLELLKQFRVFYSQMSL